MKRQKIPKKIKNFTKLAVNTYNKQSEKFYISSCFIGKTHYGFEIVIDGIREEVCRCMINLDVLSPRDYNNIIDFFSKKIIESGFKNVWIVIDSKFCFLED